MRQFFRKISNDDYVIRDDVIGYPDIPTDSSWPNEQSGITSFYELWDRKSRISLMRVPLMRKTHSVMPCSAMSFVLNVIELPSDRSIVIASILGQNTTLSCDSNQFIWIVPFDSQRQIADRVRNHVRRQGRRAKESPSFGAHAAPA